ncbi:MAG: hypothetical protein HY866_17210 [Chloroflexi bacterium]|nr:hypothetical protein [Chloroflexota bacterium]
MSRGKNLFFNCLTFVFVILTVIMAGLMFNIATDAMEPPFFAPKPTQVIPTVAALASPTPKPSWTPSLTATPTNTFTPSSTPTETPPQPSATNTATMTPSITFTPSITGTFTPSATVTPSPTNTLQPPTFTPTKTLTPTPSATWTPTYTPTGPTATSTPEFPYIVQPGSISLRQATNAAGCNWQGIGGQVTTDRAEPIAGVQIRVRGDTLAEQSTLSGTNMAYGPSGWEIQVAALTNTERYYIDLWIDNQQVSDTVQIVFPNSCQQNLAVVNFIRTRPS